MSVKRKVTVPEGSWDIGYEIMTGTRLALRVPVLTLYSLKVVFAPLAIIVTGLQTTMLESGVQSGTGTSRCGPTSRSILCRREQSAARASRGFRRGNPYGVSR